MIAYGNILEDRWAHLSGDEDLCRTLLQQFLRSGAEALQGLDGRYDIVIWDRRERLLSMVSDRFGANRHYYSCAPGALYIACEVKVLGAMLDEVAVDPAGLASMITFGYHIGELTLLRRVHRLPNACHLSWQANENLLLVDRYWNYPYGEASPPADSAEGLAESLHERLLRAVKRQLRGVDKILLPVSGGLDSRTMAGLLAQSGFTGDVLAYSFGQPSSRDVRYGSAVAAKLGYRHVVIPTPGNFVTHGMEEDAWTFDAEWSAELHWPFRTAYRDPTLGDTSGYRVLSGMFGDIVLGSDRIQLQAKAGKRARKPATTVCGLLPGQPGVWSC